MQVLPIAEHGDPTDRIRAISDRPLVVGGQAVNDLLPLVKDDGRWVITGAVGGAVVPFDMRRLYLHNLHLVGSSMHTRGHFARLVEVAQTDAVQPRIAGRYALAAIHEAQTDFSQRPHVDKIVLTP